ncbi:hypothetical protein EDD11_002003 [Mortierella claussenii]|nr:hypothetical protein EDD11_002003 [Mortierella claussenii]
MLIASAIAHFLVGLYGLWLLSYRNRGFNSKIVTGLFLKVGTGVRPKPMDCIIFFTTIGCFVKVAGNLPLVFEALQGTMWIRVAIEQLYWILVEFAFASYFVGLLYAMPVTTREGIFAVYYPEAVFGTKPLPPIHVLTPTTVQKNFILVMGAVYPTISGAGLGIASGILHDQGRYEASRVLVLLQYSNWVLILYTMAAFFFYYGLKYTFILQANIIIAEAALKAPRAAFGIGNLKSRSPARFLFIQLQITGFGGCAVTVLGGTLCLLWVLFRDKILEMKDERLPHVMAVFWTCAIAVAFFVVLTLIAAQSIRSRRRGLHEPSTTTGTGTLSHSEGGHGGSSAQKSTNGGQSGRSGQHYQQHIYGSDPEAYLTQQSSGDLSSLDSEKHSMERLDDPHDIHARYVSGPLSSPPAHHRKDSQEHDTLEGDRDRAAAAASVAAMAAMSDRMGQEAKHGRDSWRPISPTSPTRGLTIQVNNGTVTNANANTNGYNRDIRESVFGGRTARDDDSVPGLLPAHRGGGFSLPSFPLVAVRSSSRNSAQQQQQQSRPSIGSAGHSGSTHSSSRVSHGSSKHGTSSNGSVTMPLPPTSPIMAPALALQQQTQQQLQQLSQQSPHGPSSQRTQIKTGAFQSVPETLSYPDNGHWSPRHHHHHHHHQKQDIGNEEDRLFLQDPSLPQMPLPPSTPPHPPHRTKTSASSSSSRITQLSPIITNALPFPLPLPVSSPTFSTSSTGHHHESSPRPSTSSARSGGGPYGFYSQESSIYIPPDMQLQQQHPLHQVAFKGLSPPPRSTPLGPASPTQSTTRRGGGGYGMSPPTSPSTIISPFQSGSYTLPSNPLMDNAPASQALQALSSSAAAAQQASPRIGGGIRRGFDAPTTTTISGNNGNNSGGKDKHDKDKDTLSAPIPTPASAMMACRGPGGGYQSQRQDTTPSTPPLAPSISATAAVTAVPASLKAAGVKSLRQNANAFGQQQQKQQSQKQQGR